MTTEKLSDTRLIVKKAVCQLNKRNDKEALRLLDQAVSDGSDVPGLNYGKAIAVARMGRMNEAIDLLQELLHRMPEHAKARKLLAELRSRPFFDSSEIKELSRISIQRQGSSRWLPNTIYPDDVFLVSYPKSGNTWLRFLIANILKQHEEINFHTVHNCVPEVSEQEEIIDNLQRPRVMKSHAPYIREYPKVIYLIRDGRDVYVSYYFHRLKQLPADYTFREFLMRQDHYPCTWGEHVSSWLIKRSSYDFLIVKYEDLIADCVKQLRRITNFLSLEASEYQLKLAMKKSSFDNMRRLEFEKGRLYKDHGPKIFMRKGKTGDWKNFFGKNEKTIFKSREGQPLITLGYESDDRW